MRQTYLACFDHAPPTPSFPDASSVQGDYSCVHPALASLAVSSPVKVVVNPAIRHALVTQRAVAHLAALSAVTTLQLAASLVSVHDFSMVVHRSPYYKRYFLFH